MLLTLRLTLTPGRLSLLLLDTQWTGYHSLAKKAQGCLGHMTTLGCRGSREGQYSPHQWEEGVS